MDMSISQLEPPTYYRVSFKTYEIRACIVYWIDTHERACSMENCDVIKNALIALIVHIFAHTDRVVHTQMQININSKIGFQFIKFKFVHRVNGPQANIFLLVCGYSRGCSTGDTFVYNQIFAKSKEFKTLYRSLIAQQYLIQFLDVSSLVFSFSRNSASVPFHFISMTLNHFLTRYCG